MYLEYILPDFEKQIFGDDSEEEKIEEQEFDEDEEAEVDEEVLLLE